MAKRFVKYLLFTTFLISLFSINVNAQFWKRGFKKKHTIKQSNYKNDSLQHDIQPWHKVNNKREQKHRKKELEKQNREKRRKERHTQKYAVKKITPKRREINSNNRNRKTQNVVKRKAILYPPTIKKTNYRIDILAPVFLDELVKGRSVTFKNKIPDKAIAGLSFYEGVMIAADSLNKENYNLDIFIHDISSKSESIDSLIKFKKLDSTDLVIGAVLPENLITISNYCFKKHINFVSALSPTDGGVKGNKYFNIIQPTLKSHCEWIKSKLEKDYYNNNIVLLYRTTIVAEENAFHYLFSESEGNIKWEKLPCNLLPTKKELANIIDTNKTQVVVVSILDNLYADSILRVLTHEFPNTHFELFGMPAWTGLGLQKRSALHPKITFNITVPFIYDVSIPTYKYVEQKYTSTFGGKPQDLVYRGFETMMWYGNLLRKYGTIFNNKYADITAVPFTRFDINPQWDRQGKFLYNENKHIYLLKYENGEEME